MKSSYLDYAMSVIVSRALPDVRDGLKPVHRRILYGMKEEVPESNYKFSLGSAKIAREGDDITIVAIAMMVQKALEAADELNKNGISADPRGHVPDAFDPRPSQSSPRTVPELAETPKSSPTIQNHQNRLETVRK